MNREKFEQLCVQKFAEWRDAGNRANDNGGPLDRESLCWKDEHGNYGVLALNAAWWGFRMANEDFSRRESAHRVPDGLVLMPAQISEEHLTVAQGALMDMGWSATECFAVRVHRLYEITRPAVEAALNKENT